MKKIESILVDNVGTISIGESRWNIGIVEKIEQINEFTYAVYGVSGITAHYNVKYVIEVVYSA